MGKLVDVDQGIVVSARLIQLKPEGRTSARRQSRIAEAKSSDRILPNPCQPCQPLNHHYLLPPLGIQ